MIEIHSYRCDICGKCFDNREDCHKHEMGHTGSRIKNAVVMMDDDGGILPLDDIHTAIEKSYAIYVRYKDAADILWKLFEEDDYCSPITDIDTPVQYPAFFTYNARWRYMNDLEKEYNHLLELKTTAENILLQ